MKALSKIAFAFLIMMMAMGAKAFFSPTEDAPGDLIIGNWQPSDQRSVVKIYKGVAAKGENPNKYYGKIVWLKEPNDANGNPRVDVNNPDESKRGEKIMGKVVMKDLEFVGNKLILAWENGTIYDPKNGSEYNFKTTMSNKNHNQIEGKGFIGVSMFGRTDTWTRMVSKK